MENIQRNNAVFNFSTSRFIDIIDNNYEYRTIIRLEYDKYGDYDFSGKDLDSSGI